LVWYWSILGEPHGENFDEGQANLRGGKTLGRHRGRPEVPLSAVTSGIGFVFVWVAASVNHVTGELVRGDILVQTRQCLENVKAALEVAGSSMEQVLKVTIYAVNCATSRTSTRSTPSTSQRSTGTDFLYRRRVAVGIRHRDGSHRAAVVTPPR
jgi:enamine deaminase RidA (YjgF/YER057c/UK114 family)